MLSKVLSDKRGFSLMETVVSIVIVILFTVTTLGVIISSTRIYAKNNAEIKLLRELQLMETCFDTADFVAAVDFARGITVNDTGVTTVYYDGNVRVTQEQFAEYVLVMDITDDGLVRTMTAYTGNMKGDVYYEMPQYSRSSS